MNIEKIKQLIYLAEEHGLSEIEVQLSWRKKIRIVRGGKVIQQAIPMSQEQIHETPKKQDDQVSVGEEESEEKKYLEITAPIVGTFYRRPSPEDEAYVTVGDHIEKGQPVCLLEAMKIFNEIKSEVSGKIVKVTVEDGQPVEYGHTLFLVDPKA